MAKFYGTIKGNRGTASRLGSRDSGIKTSAQSYDGSVIVDLRYNDKDELIVKIKLADGSSSYDGKTFFDGKFEELKKIKILSKGD